MLLLSCAQVEYVDDDNILLDEEDMEDIAEEYSGEEDSQQESDMASGSEDEEEPGSSGSDQEAPQSAGGALHARQQQPELLPRQHHDSDHCIHGSACVDGHGMLNSSSHARQPPQQEPHQCAPELLWAAATSSR